MTYGFSLDTAFKYLMKSQSRYDAERGYTTTKLRVIEEYEDIIFCMTENNIGNAYLHILFRAGPFSDHWFIQNITDNQVDKLEERLRPIYKWICAHNEVKLILDKPPMALEHRVSVPENEGDNGTKRDKEVTKPISRSGCGLGVSQVRPGEIPKA